MVDDNRINRQIITKVLKKLGMAADEADCGTDGLAQAVSNDYDLIFLDIAMPDISGILVCQSIRKLPGKRQPYVIAYTANCMQDDLELYLSSGMNDVLSKPFVQKQLKE